MSWRKNLSNLHNFFCLRHEMKKLSHNRFSYRSLLSFHYRARHKLKICVVGNIAPLGGRKSLPQSMCLHNNKTEKKIIKHEQFNFICGAETLFVPFWFPPFCKFMMKIVFSVSNCADCNDTCWSLHEHFVLKGGEDELNDGESSWEILFWHAIPTTAARFGVQ